jgi:DNA recombination protein RmuC
MEILYALIGLAVGIFVFWLLTRRNQTNIFQADQQNALFDEKSRNAALAATLEQTEKQITQLKENYDSQKKEIETKNSELIKQQKEFYESKLSTIETEFEACKRARITAEASLTDSRSHFRQQEDRIKAQKEEIEALNERFKKEFENIANKIFENKSQRFTEQNKNSLEALLNPLKERIQLFEKKVDDSYKQEASERNSLKGEIKSLLELNAKISNDANNLAKALKGDNKLQGNWGERILESILEGSGLLKNQMYKTQVTLSNAAGEIIKPDAVVYLPENKHIIIDSKVSLLAYNNFIMVESEDEKQKWIKEHINSLRSHVKLLSDKNYYTSIQLNTPEFVLMFVPIESSFAMALQNDIDLFNYAWERKIIIVSPSTLQATLMTISSIWKQEMQTRNAIEIAAEGGKLYDKFAAFVEDLEKIKSAIDRSGEAYDAAMNKLKSGKGNLLNRVEHLKRLGAKASKQIPDRLLDIESDDEEGNE